MSITMPASTTPAATASRTEAPVVVVTGASAGVGRATVLRFARDGARIGLIARSADALAEVAREVEALGGKALPLPLDVADAEAVFTAAERVERELGPIDIWVNDAMATVFSPVSEITPEEFRRVTEVTYLGFVHGSMAALRHMRPRDRGAIVQVGSALAYRGIPLQSAYCGAKHAIKGFTSSLRTELVAEKSRVRVTMVDLPAVNTPQFDWARTHLDTTPRPVGKAVHPGVAADAIHRAAYGHWREYWLGLPTAETILGNFVAPGLLDRYLGKVAWEGQKTGDPLPPERKDNLMDPVPGLHRTTGSFGSEGGGSAMLLPGPVARLGVVALGGAALFGLGVTWALLGRRGRG